MSGKPSITQLQHLWAFARGDADAFVFERWFLEETGLEGFLGEHLHWELTSSDYSERDTVWRLRDALHRLLEPPEGCECLALRDLAVVPMGCDGLDERVFSTVKRTRNHGGKQWWLHLASCQQCGQDWMIAQEERIYDDFVLKRITKKQATVVEDRGEWPPDFSTYEKVLRLTRELSTPPIWFDIRESPLRETIDELRAENTKLTLEEAAYLVGIKADELKQIGY
ncbi:MAG TPA: hypothetical protein VGA34_09910 [Alteraurantiacibacter sp.]